MVLIRPPANRNRILLNLFWLFSEMPGVCDEGVFWFESRLFRPHISPFLVKETFVEKGTCMLGNIHLHLADVVVVHFEKPAHHII